MRASKTPRDRRRDVVGTLGRSLGACAVLVAWCAPAVAQIEPPDEPFYSAVDENGVSFASGSPTFSLLDVTIGSGDSSMSHTLYSRGSRMVVVEDSLRGYMKGETDPIYLNQTTSYPGYLIRWDGTTERFYLASGTYQSGTFVALSRNGSTLVVNADGTYTHKTRDGVILTLSPRENAFPVTRNHVTRVQYPDGRVLTMNRTSDGLLRSVTRNDGLQMKYNYSGIDTSSLTSVVAINNAYEYCDPLAATCSLAQSWPTATYVSTGTANFGGVVTITDALGRVTRYTHAGTRVSAIKLPTSASADNITYTYCGVECFAGTKQFPGMVKQVVRDGQTWQYAYTPGMGSSLSTYTSTNPQGLTTRALIAATFAPDSQYVSPIGDVDGPLGSASWDVRDVSGRILSGQSPAGQSEVPEYDTRGNVVTMTYNPRSGSANPSRIFTANYSATCANAVTCNKPNYVIDARGKRTDFTYDPVHGGVLSETGPADNSGVRPQRRYEYAQRYAWFKNASGSYVRAATPIWVRTKLKYCRTSSAVSGNCTAAGDEVVVSYDYGPDSGPNNLFDRGVTTTADGVTLRTCYGRDSRGNMISETKPRAGLASCP